MPISEQEQKDLDKLHRDMNLKRENTLSYMRDVLRWKPEDFKMSGHTGKTIGQVLEYILRSHLKDMEKLTNEHLKKYPD